MRVALEMKYLSPSSSSSGLPKGAATFAMLARHLFSTAASWFHTHRRIQETSYPLRQPSWIETNGLHPSIPDCNRSHSSPSTAAFTHGGNYVGSYENRWVPLNYFDNIAQFGSGDALQLCICATCRTRERLLRGNRRSHLPHMIASHIAKFVIELINSVTK